MNDFKLTRKQYTKDEIPFLLRPATIEDSETIIKNINEICDEKHYMYTDEFILTEDWKEVLNVKSIDNERGHLLIVAQVGDRVVGNLRLFRLWYGSKTYHVGEVGLAIIKEWRERGIGTAMLNYALEWTKSASLKKLITSIISTNQRALNLFKKFHFVKEGHRVHQFMINGQYLDEILMARFLKDF